MGLVGIFVRLLTKVVAIFRRMLCFMHIIRHRKNSGTILPLHADTKTLAVGEVQTSLPTNDIELESWDSWGMEDRSEFGHVKSNSMQNSSAAGQVGGNRFPNRKLQMDPDPEPETDYFQELQLEPSISRTQKILIRKKDELQHNHFAGGFSTRLAMTSDIPLPSSELGVLEDQESGWGAEAAEDLTSEANSAIRDKRRLERERKIAEHQQKKLQKESARVGKKDGVIAKLS